MFSFFFLISNNFIEREKNQTSTQVVNLIEGKKKKNRKIKDELNNVQSCQTRNLKNLNEKPLNSQEGSAGI